MHDFSSIRRIDTEAEPASRQRRENFGERMGAAELTRLAQTLSNRGVHGRCHERGTIPIHVHRASRSPRIASRIVCESACACTMSIPFTDLTATNGASVALISRKTTRSLATSSSKKRSPGEKRFGKTARRLESSFRTSGIVGNSHTAKRLSILPFTPRVEWEGSPVRRAEIRSPYFISVSSLRSLMRNSESGPST